MAEAATVSATRAARRRQARELAKQATRPGVPRVSGVITDTGEFEQAPRSNRCTASRQAVARAGGGGVS